MGLILESFSPTLTLPVVRSRQENVVRTKVRWSIELDQPEERTIVEDLAAAAL